MEESRTALEQVLDAVVTQEAQEEREWNLETRGELFPVSLSEEEVEKADFKEQRGEYLSVRGVKGEITFHDVPVSSWYAPYVRELTGLGLFSGYEDEQGKPLGEFRPENPVTVEELAKLTVGLTGSGVALCSGTSMNTEAVGRWSESYLSCAEEWDWVLFSDATVQVDRPALRSEVIVTVLQALRVPFGGGVGDVFVDVGGSTEFGGAIERAAGDGILSGYVDALGVPLHLFGPGDPITRAQLAKILVLGLQVYGGK